MKYQTYWVLKNGVIRKKGANHVKIKIIMKSFIHKFESMPPDRNIIDN